MFLAKVVSPQTAKVQKPANNNDIPNKTAFGAQKSAEKQKGFQSEFHILICCLYFEINV
jgi:hypothetical protein